MFDARPRRIVSKTKIVGDDRLKKAAPLSAPTTTTGCGHDLDSTPNTKSANPVHPDMWCFASLFASPLIRRSFLLEISTNMFVHTFRVTMHLNDILRIECNVSKPWNHPLNTAAVGGEGNSRSEEAWSSPDYPERTFLADVFWRAIRWFMGIFAA